MPLQAEVGVVKCWSRLLADPFVRLEPSLAEAQTYYSHYALWDWEHEKLTAYRAVSNKRPMSQESQASSLWW